MAYGLIRSTYAGVAIGAWQQALLDEFTALTGVLEAGGAAVLTLDHLVVFSDQLDDPAFRLILWGLDDQEQLGAALGVQILIATRWTDVLGIMMGFSQGLPAVLAG